MICDSRKIWIQELLRNWSVEVNCAPWLVWLGCHTSGTEQYPWRTGWKKGLRKFHIISETWDKTMQFTQMVRWINCIVEGDCNYKKKFRRFEIFAWIFFQPRSERSSESVSFKIEWLGVASDGWRTGNVDKGETKSSEVPRPMIRGCPQKCWIKYEMILEFATSCQVKAASTNYVPLVAIFNQLYIYTPTMTPSLSSSPLLSRCYIISLNTP